MFNGEKGWFIKFTIKNVSDVPFNPQRAAALFYEGDRLDSIINYSAEDIISQLQSDKMIKGELPFNPGLCSDRQYLTSIQFVISGKDDNGHELEFSCTVPFVQE